MSLPSLTTVNGSTGEALTLHDVLDAPGETA
jgi:hypothetical protein